MAAVPVNYIEVVDGKPLIQGTHIKAVMVASLHVNGGATIEEVMEHYSLSRAQVHAALAYYYENQQEIEQSFREAEAYVREIGTPIEDVIARMRARKQENE